MMKKIKYIETPSFKRDLKKLRKRFKSLPEDIEVAKRSAIELLHIQGIDNKSVVSIVGYSNQRYRCYKLRRFACRALKGRGVKSGIRIIYAFDEVGGEITFIEIYFKGDKENEDKGKIKGFLEHAI